MTNISKTPSLLGRLRSLLLWLLAACVGLYALFIFAAYLYTYSSGDRAGYVQKFSKKGWICKTWEGELAMVNLPGAMTEVFQFTVRDDAVAAEINKLVGQRVSVTYEQHLGLPSCLGDTEYFVKAIHVVGPPPSDRKEDTPPAN